MEIEEIDVFVDAEGTVRMEVRGVKGKRCMSLTEETEKLLGGSAERKVTPEYYEEDEGDTVTPPVHAGH